MLMAMKEGQILIKEADSSQFTVIKSWNLMRWVKSEQMFKGPVTRDLLNRLAALVRLPGTVEKERVRLNQISGAIDRERLNPDPEPLLTPPVKVKPYQHQIRGYNMALIALGLAEAPEEVEQRGA